MIERLHPWDLTRIVVAVDPATTSGEESDDTGIIVAGRGRDGDGYVLDDQTCHESPDGWARRVKFCYDRWQADRVIAEANNGGELVSTVLNTVDSSMAITLVHAARGKQTRAEPVAALYEQGRVHHVGAFPELEDQLCEWVPGQGDSPDRLDACLVAGTLVATANGETPIERVRAGDVVRTRTGWRRVLTAGMTCSHAPTLTVETAGGIALRGTREHPVWVENQGWTPLDSLVSGRASIGSSRPHARERVVRSYASAAAPVFNLEVEGEPEYFANGLLVHNCVWALTELLVGSAAPVPADFSFFGGAPQASRWKLD